MSARDVIVDAMCAVWNIADAERDADAILSALHAAGYVVVPREPLMRVVSGDQRPGGGRLVLEADLMALEKAVAAAQESPDEG